MDLRQQVSSVQMFRDTETEKRQLFLRSYQFSRKRSVAERIKGSFFRVKRVIWIRLRSARKLRRIVWLKLKHGLFSWRRNRVFLRLHKHNTSFADSCFW
nr:Lamin tail domain-containing protein [Ipomoea batatas]GME18255.1 Lamin tail domain-containing protein [Ipomoea batatas]GME19589.1 Lamin tail domain-containing protein [Ipomoea batatas]GME19590.1 Lamin tail domain-containing protein [Ipomoea batatas]